MATYRDSIFQEFKLYIEGVQVPFTNININQSAGSLPSANISIPPMAGLMDIARFYQPKVHVFFTERTIDATGNANTVEKVLFTGLIATAHYSKSKDGNGNMGIVFDCVHRYFLITECLVDYCGFIRDQGVGSMPDQTYSSASNSKAAIQEALNGWNQISTGAQQDYSKASPTGLLDSGGRSRTDILPSYLADVSNRLKGMVGVFINFWNQRKRDCYNPSLSNFQGSFINVYEPLIETGLQFFKRLSGHMLIEQANDNGRLNGCGKSGGESWLVPPCNKLFFSSAVQASLTVDTLNSQLQNSNEITNIYDIFQRYYNSLEYDILTLASPAEVLKDPLTRTKPKSETYAVDTIVKPSLPFYFSPTCNIIYPSMYTSISVSYDESSMPTRLDVLNNEIIGTSNYETHYRTPSSIRSAIADKQGKDQNLHSTLNTSGGAIGRYEMGRGIKYESISMPSWMTHVAASQNQQPGSNTSVTPSNGSSDDIANTSLKKGWNARYPNNPKLNPYSAEDITGILPHQQLVFSTADYYYTKKFASTKAGSINCVFNPYIIPGYPMDILEASPNLPSFHAQCVAVSHTITASSVYTQVSVAAAMTYTELVNYYVPFINPFLQVTLGLAENPTLVSTDSSGIAISKANDFYFPTLGVNAAAPDSLFNFATGETLSVKMSEGKLASSGEELRDHTTEGDIQLCQRPIESKADYSARMGITFIDMVPQNYTATGVKYKDPTLSDHGTTSTKFEIGQSQFLDYSDEIYQKINTNIVR